MNKTSFILDRPWCPSLNSVARVNPRTAIPHFSVVLSHRRMKEYTLYKLQPFTVGPRHLMQRNLPNRLQGVPN